MNKTFVSCFLFLCAVSVSSVTVAKQQRSPLFCKGSVKKDCREINASKKSIQPINSPQEQQPSQDKGPCFSGFTFIPIPGFGYQCLLPQNQKEIASGKVEELLFNSDI